MPQQVPTDKKDNLSVFASESSPQGCAWGTITAAVRVPEAGGRKAGAGHAAPSIRSVSLTLVPFSTRKTHPTRS